MRVALALPCREEVEVGGQNAGMQIVKSGGSTAAHGPTAYTLVVERLERHQLQGTLLQGSEFMTLICTHAANQHF